AHITGQRMSEPEKKTAVRDEILSTAEIRIEQLGDDVIGRIASGRVDHGSNSAFQPGAAGF
ncbi:MAG: hypothetical protein WAM77_03500, partial [Xanthobacteraceae bacterium]